MKKFLSLMIILCACTTFATAQNSSDDFRKFEVFAGYTIDQDQREPNDRFATILGFTPAQLQALLLQPINQNSGRTRYNGFNVAGTGYFTKHFGITGDFSAAYKTEDQPIGKAGSRVRRQKYNFLVGPQVKFRGESRVEPFARVMFGAARLKNQINPDNSTVVAGGLTIGQIDDDYTAFAMGIGGGIDVRVGKNVKLRLIQVDYNPVFSKDRNLTVTNAKFAGQTLSGSTVVRGYRRDNVRLSFGIVF